MDIVKESNGTIQLQLCKTPHSNPRVWSMSMKSELTAIIKFYTIKQHEVARAVVFHAPFLKLWDVWMETNFLS